MTLDIRFLRQSDEPAFHEALSRFSNLDSDKDFIFALNYDPSQTFDYYVQLLIDHSEGKRLPEGYVPGDLLFAFLGGELVGRLSIRKQSTPFIGVEVGHIGYAVIDHYRGKGFAQELLSFGLQRCRDLNISPVVVTCNKANLASKRVIEHCGGRFANELISGKTGVAKSLIHFQLRHYTGSPLSQVWKTQLKLCVKLLNV